MLGQVTHDKVPPRAGDPLVSDRFGAELGRERREQRPQRRERVEHLLVPGRVGAPAGDGVAAVPSVATDRSEELDAALQRVADGSAQRERLCPAQSVCLTVDTQPDRLPVTLDADRWLLVGGERDQEGGDSAYSG